MLKILNLGQGDVFVWSCIYTKLHSYILHFRRYDEGLRTILFLTFRSHSWFYNVYSMQKKENVKEVVSSLSMFVLKMKYKDVEANLFSYIISDLLAWTTLPRPCIILRNNKYKSTHSTLYTSPAHRHFQFK